MGQRGRPCLLQGCAGCRIWPCCSEEIQNAGFQTHTKTVQYIPFSWFEFIRVADLLWVFFGYETDDFSHGLCAGTIPFFHLFSDSVSCGSSSRKKTIVGHLLCYYFENAIEELTAVVCGLIAVVNEAEHGEFIFVGNLRLGKSGMVGWEEYFPTNVGEVLEKASSVFCIGGVTHWEKRGVGVLDEGSNGQLGSYGDIVPFN